MLIVKDKNLNELGILENAYDISVKTPLNELWTASFTLPKSDDKNSLCDHFHYVEIIGDSGTNYGLYSILPINDSMGADHDNIKYTCEHVLDTLLYDIILGYHQISGKTTGESIAYILSLQTTQNWVLGECDFTNHFGYTFENENGLLAPLLSIPKSLNEEYEFSFDTTVYPWKLNLKRPSNEVKSETRYRKDMLIYDRTNDPSNLVNHVVPLGSGEGVNQLNIASVNNGNNFLKDDASIAQWGFRPYIWIDKRYTDAQSLKNDAQAFLDKWKIPKLSFKCTDLDLSVLPEYEDEKKLLGTITRVITEDYELEERIVGITIPDLSKEWEKDYEINSKVADISTAQTDIVRKQQVSDAYSQGATNILPFQYMDNADNTHPATIRFFVDDDVVNINTCELTFELKKFRAYSQATEGGGNSTQTSSSGGGTTATSSSGGGTSTSTSSGGGSTQTSSAGGGTTATSSTQTFESYTITTGTPTTSEYATHMHTLGFDGSAFNHSHDITIDAHTHDVSIPDHAHDFSTPDHTHDVSIPDHTHNVSIPSHTHSVKQGIYELDSIPSSVTIKVDGNIVTYTQNNADRLSLVDYLSKDSNGKIVRGKHTVEILPADLARIEAFVILRVFITSQLGSVY